MKQSTGIALVVFMTAGALSLRSCNQSDCSAHPDQAKCQSSGGGHGGYFGGGSGSDDAAHGVTTGGFGDSAGAHGGGGGE